MINEVFEIFKNLLYVVGGAIIISLVGVGMLLLVERIIERFKNKK